MSLKYEPASEPLHSSDYGESDYDKRKQQLEDEQFERAR